MLASENVRIDPGSTALHMLDFDKQTCTETCTAKAALEALAIAADARPGDSNFKLHTIQISFTEGKR